MEIVTILVALILIWLAWKVLMGLVKFGVIAAIAVLAIWFLASGGFGA